MSKQTTDRNQKGGYAVPVVIDTAANAKRVDDAKRVAIFEIDGVVYDMPGVARSEIALTYLELADREGDDAAAYYLISECLGAEAYDALKSVKGLTDEQFEGIVVRLQAVALPKGQKPTPTRSNR